MSWIVRESSPSIKGKGNLLTQGYNLRNLIIFDILYVWDMVCLWFIICILFYYYIVKKKI